MSTTHRPAKVTPAKTPVSPGRAALAAVRTRHSARKAADLALVLSVVVWAVEHTGGEVPGVGGSAGVVVDDVVEVVVPGGPGAVEKGDLLSRNPLST